MPRPFATWSRIVLAVGAGAVATLLVALSVASPAAAHSATGGLELVSIEPATGDLARVTVVFRYDDDHPVQEAVVRLGGLRSDDVALLPVTFSATDEPGRLVADAALPGPGRWDLRITSTDPAAELRATYDPSDPAAAPGTAAGGEFTSEDRGGRPFVWIAAGCATVLAVFVIATRRRSARSR